MSAAKQWLAGGVLSLLTASCGGSTNASLTSPTAAAPISPSGNSIWGVVTAVPHGVAWTPQTGTGVEGVLVEETNSHERALTGASGTFTIAGVSGPYAFSLSKPGYFDAHPDLYDEFEGNRFSHASPFARVMEEGLAARLVQVGIRTMSGPQRLQVERFGVEVVEMRHFRPGLALGLEGPVYVTVDLDAFDPAFAPGVSHHEPGGLATRDVVDIILGLEAPVVGADVVEYNPTRDVVGVTAMLAAKLAKELAGRMLEHL